MSALFRPLCLAACLTLTACPPVPTGDDDDATGDDDDATGDDDDSAGGDDDDDAPEDFVAIFLHGPFSGDATVATVDSDGEVIDAAILGLVGSDWGVQISDGDPWLLGRYGTDVIRRYEGLDFSAPTLEFSVGSPSNPYAARVCADRIFVTRYGLVEGGEAGGDLAIYDTTSGSPRGRVDLSAFHEGADGTPEPASTVQLGDRLYVALNRLDRNAGWAADPVGKVIEVDCASEAVTNHWDTGPNPRLIRDPRNVEALVVLTRGGAAALDPSTDEVVPGLDAEALGGGLLGLAGSAAGLIAITEDPDGTNRVWCVDPSSWAASAFGSSSARSWGLASAPDGTAWALWIDHWATPGVDPGGFSILDPATCTERTDGLVELPTDPISVAFLPR